MEWKQLFTSDNKPKIKDIEMYLDKNSLVAFKEFTQYLAENFLLTYVVPIYSKKLGWKYQFGKSGFIFLRNVCFYNNQFLIEDVEIIDDSSFEKVKQLINEMYIEKLPEYEVFGKKRRERRKKYDQKVKEIEKIKSEDLKDKIVTAKFNVFRWSPCVPRETLLQLYISDSKGIDDIELADEIGYTFYARCNQAIIEKDLMMHNKIKCHNCQEVLNNNGEVVTCNCGHQYLFKNYRRSFRTNNMPHGAAIKIFLDFIDKWPAAKTYTSKMIIIDNLVHEFHTNIKSGVKNRPVAINLIRGTNSQVIKLINQLAYGDCSTASIENKEYWDTNIKRRL